jgi:hypothetical protein
VPVARVAILMVLALRWAAIKEDQQRAIRPFILKRIQLKRIQQVLERSGDIANILLVYPVSDGAGHGTTDRGISKALIRGGQPPPCRRRGEGDRMRNGFAETLPGACLWHVGGVAAQSG